VKVSVVLPVYNSVKFLSEAIDSILAQDFTDWELLIINEYNSDDGSADIVREYAKRDSRIRFIQNSKRLGLAESLNLGIREAKGEYIARLDADDIALPMRFSKQVEFLDGNPHVGVCGSWQHHFSSEGDWIHKPPADISLCKAYLMFYCHICHSTLMLRKNIFLENQLFYDNSFEIEDFELWSRAINVTDFYNIPEVLGKYRRHQTQRNAVEDLGALDIDCAQIVSAALKRSLNLFLPESDKVFFWGFITPGELVSHFSNKEAMLSQLKRVILRIYIANKKVRFFDEDALLAVMNAKWRWAKSGYSWQEPVFVNTIDEIFGQRVSGAFWAKLGRFLREYPTFSMRYKKVYSKVISIFRKNRRRSQNV